MNILIMEWNAFGDEMMKKAFRKLGHQVVCFDFTERSEQTGFGEKMGRRITEAILKSNIDVVFSFNFYPVIATAVHACRKKYISWVYDSPAVLLYSMTVFFPGNYIFHFDSHEVERMRREGVEKVYYLPLAADVEKYDDMIPDEEIRKKYGADVAMVGSMYLEKFRYFDKYTNFDDHLRGYLDAVVSAQEQVQGINFLQDVLTADIMKKVVYTVPLMEEKGDRYDSAEWDFANYYLAMRVAAQEREHILSALSERHDVALYTTEATPSLKRVRNMGSADYYTEAPYAIKCAKINLNITLRSIQNGIPQRVMDIMGCGGFVLSNYQIDMAEAFVPGEDYVYYESLEDAVEKTEYYLTHEEERVHVARNGYEKVKKTHRYELKCEQMMEMIID